MKKRVLHHYEKRLQPISGWYFLLAAVIFFSIAAFALRQNNLRMLELREEVFIADEAGENIEESLRELREHVHGHMNTDLTADDSAIHPPIQLVHTYERLVAKEQEKVREQNEDVYQQAEQVCEERFSAGQLEQRVQCVSQYVEEQGVEPNPVPKELYQFDFASPRWSPDLAGWSLVLGAFSVILFAARTGFEAWLKYKLRH